ncbi:hypothetical protein ONO23_01826 [Micromonospora noduli]|uniref:Uncharacterized protein n=1 Tax=Micromonospora noduli TaxID=709876 RepID=A0ABX9CVQ3_9ACTN|nr:hypothetical protein [Micromonospora noduli]KAB1925317.1 hypothetical protein F8280_11690 [Micromonospora noduli]RAO10709.1 hypothetical protein LUPAC07_05236 [Micromonospora noduli]RAO12010.1 hypothetical protein MED15_05019 [Micromonospora noduli]RAO36769.1 hypothetical protein ONO23_01826 [Micromonospora noduli]RAO52573.1 hypothetical protein ONO86_01771 [Micromonospora noduli]
MGERDAREWRDQQRQAVRAHADADARRRAAEHAEAAELVAWFVAEATRRGLPTTRLAARGYDGRGRYRTGLTGWYVDRAETRAVDVAGRFHLLTVPGGLRARLFGVDPQPSPAPLVVGAGGRDGESIPLRTLLNRLLNDGTGEPGSTTRPAAPRG